MLYLNTVGRCLKRSHLMYGSLTKQKVAELSSNCWPPDKRRIRVTKYKKPNSKHLLLLVYCCCRHLNVYSKSVKLIFHIFPNGQVTSNNLVHKKKSSAQSSFSWPFMWCDPFCCRSWSQHWEGKGSHHMKSLGKLIPTNSRIANAWLGSTFRND